MIRSEIVWKSMQFSKVLKESTSKVWQEFFLCLQLSAADEVEIVEQNRSLLLSASSVPFGSPVQASWSVPVDEATNKDWIGGLFNLLDLAHSSSSLPVSMYLKKYLITNNMNFKLIIIVLSWITVAFFRKFNGVDIPFSISWSWKVQTHKNVYWYTSPHAWAYLFLCS